MPKGIILHLSLRRDQVSLCGSLTKEVGGFVIYRLKKYYMLLVDYVLRFLGRILIFNQYQLLMVKQSK